MKSDSTIWLLRAGRASATALVSLALGGCAPPPREVRPAAHYGSELETPPQPIRASPPPAAENVNERSSAEPDIGTEKEPPPVERKLGQLGPFYDAVDALRANKRDTSVRILWLGDSHTAADFMTQPVREHLARLGGYGGPGFVRLGLDGYRHGAAEVKSFGRWRKAPILPAQRTRVMDGVFGYGGIRTLPVAGAGAGASLRKTSGRELVWTLSVRLLHRAKLDVKVGDVRVRASFDEEETLPGGLQWVPVLGTDTEALEVHHAGGDPEVFGVFADYTVPGVVLDTVGINGARTATPLAWESEQYVAQVRARKPDLLVLAFGTNEVFDQTRPDRYIEHNTKLVELVRQARPEIPCWIVGPPDSSTKEGTSKARVSEVNRAQARAADMIGCAFTSAFELMGGEGSFHRWTREKPAKARSDRIHLTIAGYTRLGELLAHSLIGGVPLGEAMESGEEEPLSPPSAKSTRSVP